MADLQGTLHNLINVSSFSLEIDKVTVATFTEVSGIGSETDVITANVVNIKGQRVVQKLSGQHKYGEITIKRVYNGDDVLFQWRKQVLDGETMKYRRNGTITAHTLKGIPIVKWNIVNCWPSNWKLSDLAAGTDEAMTEELTITHEGIEQVKA